MEHTRQTLCIIAMLGILSACTETIYQPYPATATGTIPGTSTSTTNVLSDQTTGATAPGNSAAETAATTTSKSDQFESLSETAATENVDNSSAIAAAGANTAEVNAAIANAAGSSESTIYTPAVTGEAGEIVDCELKLPCRWVATDEDFNLTVGNVGNTGTLGRLSILFTLSASHDSEMMLGNGSSALAPGGAEFNLIQQALGDSNGITAQSVLAGEIVTGSATYDRESESGTLAGWTLTVIDNGLPRTVGFINLPIDMPDTLVVNCAGVLPCQWQSSLKDATLTLVAVGGYTANGRLNVNFNLETTRDMDVILGAGASAIGSLGEKFDGRTHGLGAETGFADVMASTASGVILPGNISFFRTSQAPSALNSLNLVLYEDAPIPRWNPQFINLPTQ